MRSWEDACVHTLSLVTHAKVPNALQSLPALPTHTDTPRPRAHTTAELITGVRTVWVAITTPCVWDTDTTQNATQLALLTGLEGAVEKILVRVSSATTDVITGARTGSQWLALPFLSTWLNP